MRRREFVAGLAGAAAWPFGARAQQFAMPVIGFLRSTSLSNVTHLVSAFGQGLSETGMIQGEHVSIELHSAEGDPDQLRILAAELIRRPVAVIVGNSIAALAAKAETRAVPIVFAGGGDPV